MLISELRMGIFYFLHVLKLLLKRLHIRSIVAQSFSLGTVILM